MATIRSIINGFLGLKKDPNATTQDVAVIKVEDTNAGLVLNPNGTGAILRNIPNGSTGGNARGKYATDFAVNETFLPENVASGDYSFAVGYSSRASGVGSFAAGHNRNLATNSGSFAAGVQSQATGLYSVAIGKSQTASQRGSVALGGYNTGNISNGFSSFVAGDSNNVTNHYSTIPGGESNTVSSAYSTVSGGQNNTASTNTHATVVGGYLNTASGLYSVAGGVGSVASGKGSVAIGTNDPGAGNVASGIGAVALGGRTNASGNYSFTGGRENLTNSGVASILYGDSNSNTASYNATFGRFNSSSGTYNLAFGQGTIAAYEGALSFQSRAATSSVSDRGIAQSHQLTMQKTANLNSAGTTPLTIDGNILLLIPRANDIAWNVTVEYVAVCTAAGSGTTVVGDVVTGTDKFRFKRVSGTSTIGTVTNIELTQDASMTSAECQYSVGGSNNLQIEFVAPTTANATTFRVVAKVSLVEVAW